MKMYQQQLGSKKLLWEKQENNVAPLSLPRLLDFPVREIEKGFSDRKKERKRLFLYVLNSHGYTSGIGDVPSGLDNVVKQFVSRDYRYCGHCHVERWKLIREPVSKTWLTFCSSTVK